MEGLIKSTRDYLGYIEEHYGNVQKAWKTVQEKCKDMRFVWDDYYWACLDEEVKGHDISKLSSEEFTQYRDKFFPVLEKERVKEAFDSAWENHKEKNDHHWQKWTATKYPNPNSWEVHCAHMVIDWMAMGIKFNDTAKSYYESNKGSIKLPDYAILFIYEIFSRVYE